MPSFERTAEQLLKEMEGSSHVRMSVRAQSLPAMGLERTGPAFDYVFLTQDALCFLQPNPAPPMLARLPLTSLASLEWNGQNLFPEAESGAEVDIAEAIKGWGTQIKGATIEHSSAQKFFELWTRWALKPSDLRFVQAVATAAGLARQDDPEVGITTWTRQSMSPDEPLDAPTDTGSSDEASAMAIDRGFGSEVDEPTLTSDRSGTPDHPNLEVSSKHWVGAEDRFAKLLDEFIDNADIQKLVSISMKDLESPAAVIDEVFQSNAQMLVKTGVPQEIAQLLYTFMLWGYELAARLLALRGHQPNTTSSDTIDLRLAEFWAKFDIDELSDAGFYVLDNLRGMAIRSAIASAVPSMSSDLLYSLEVKGNEGIGIGAVLAMAETGVDDL